LLVNTGKLNWANGIAAASHSASHLHALYRSIAPPIQPLFNSFTRAGQDPLSPLPLPLPWCVRSPTSTLFTSRLSTSLSLLPPAPRRSPCILHRRILALGPRPSAKKRFTWDIGRNHRRLNSYSPRRISHAFPLSEALPRPSSVLKNRPRNQAPR
jgi:hypothetical protein